MFKPGAVLAENVHLRAVRASKNLLTTGAVEFRRPSIVPDQAKSFMAAFTGLGFVLVHAAA